MPLIGLVGNIGSGKSHAALYLQNKLDYHEISFADPIKEVASVFGFKKDELYGNQSQKNKKNQFWNVSGREFLQKFGTDICRNLLPSSLPTMQDVWIRVFSQRYKERMMNENIIVSDVRFADEAECIRTLGGSLIRINRDLPNNDHCLHESETELKLIPTDYVINNNNSIEIFELNLYNICTSIALTSN